MPEKITKRSYKYVTGTELRSLMSKMKSKSVNSGFRSVESWIEVIELEMPKEGIPEEEFYEYRDKYFVNQQYYDVVLFFKKINND